MTCRDSHVTTKTRARMTFTGWSPPGTLSQVHGRLALSHCRGCHRGPVKLQVGDQRSPPCSPLAALWEGGSGWEERQDGVTGGQGGLCHGKERLSF